MNTNLAEYLTAIGATQTVTDRVERILTQYERSLRIPDINDIFLCDIVNAEAVRVFTALWLFSPNYLMEAKDFLSQDDFDICPYTGRLSYLQVNKTNYDFSTPTEQSRLYIEFRMTERVGGELRASSTNCDHLFRILTKYLLPNMRT